jgi:UDP-N-acetylglucosamine acyltransferase
MIHDTAIIAPGAEIGPNVKIGPYAIIGEHVKIGEGTIIHPHVVITGRTTIGKHCEFFQGASIGEVPQDLKYRGEDTATIIGDNTTIRECATVHRAVGEGNETRIGNNVLMMAYTHVAHNCIVGNNVIMSNVATLAGHVIVEDRAVIGGLTAVHQFTKIGRNCMCGGMSRINQDVPPFVIVAGNPAYVAGLNSVGISRAGISLEVRRELKKAYKILYKRGLSLADAISTMEQELNSYEEVEHFMRFLRSVERGICRATSQHSKEW